MQRVLKFIGGGVAATVVDYVVYTFFVMVIFGGECGDGVAGFDIFWNCGNVCSIHPT